MQAPKPYKNLAIKREDHIHYFFTCPFHEGDSEASMCVNKSNTPYPLYFKCFACGEYGSPESFAEAMGMKYKHKAVSTPTVEKVEVDWDNLDLKDVDSHIIELARLLEVKPDSVKYYGVQWHEYERCYYIPMFNGSKKCGYQRRYPHGEKKTVRHSKQGFFIPKHKFSLDKPLFICEGFSDACVVTNLGFQAIGRYNASHVKMPKGVLKFKQVYIMADTDECGIAGAKKVQDAIPNSCLRIPQTLHGISQHFYRDIRQMVHSEGHSKVKEWLVENMGVLK